MPPRKQETIVFNDGINDGIYEGETQAGECHGEGTYTWENGDKYIGEFQNGVMHGHGCYRWSNGDTYVGEWQNNNMHGNGSLTLTTGKTYIGEWQYDKMHGYGKQNFLSGDYYEGYYQRDQRHGYGSYRWSNGDNYVGMWHEDDQHGHGCYQLSNGRIRLGRWVHGKQQGTFLMGDTRAPRRTYSETFQNNLLLDREALPQQMASRFLTLPSTNTFYDAFFKTVNEQRALKAQQLRATSQRRKKRKSTHALLNEKIKRRKADKPIKAHQVKQYIDLRQSIQKLKEEQDTSVDDETCFYCTDAHAGEELHQTQSETKHSACAACAGQMDDCPLCRTPITETNRLGMR